MVKEGFTTAEFAKLSLAQDRSDALVKTEMVAMNAIKGLFADDNGNFTVRKEPDFVMANELMNNEVYHQMKAAIMQPIDEFYNMFEGRTTAVVAHYLKIAQTLFVLIITLALIILIISSFSYAVLRRQIVKRESAEKNLVETNKNLENQVKIRTKNLERSETELKRALAVAERTNKLMVGRELEMIELKKGLSKKPDET
jgi:methyl-accepting chemotaxis protein